MFSKVSRFWRPIGAGCQTRFGVSCRSAFGGFPSRKLTSKFLGWTTAMVIACAGLICQAAADVKTPASAEVSPLGIMDFPAAVRVALERSPYFTKSSLEIDVRRLDEADSRYEFIPNVTLRTRYYVKASQSSSIDSDGYAIEFFTGEYNPLEAYLSLKARKLITQMAVLAHLKAIGEGIHRLAREFLRLDLLEKRLVFQDRLISLSRQKLKYVESRRDMGATSLVEVRLAAQELELVKAERERLESSRASAVDGLRAFLGLPDSQKLYPDVREASQQVFGDFVPEAATVKEILDHSFEVRIQDLKKKLQAGNVTRAYTEFIPTLFFSVRNPDPLNVSQDRDFYFAIGFNMPLWDGLKRARNVSRQKILLRQCDAEEALMKNDAEGLWREAKGALADASMALKLAESNRELARLKERQSEIRYKTNSHRLSELLDRRMELLEAERTVFEKALVYDLAVLELSHLAGDLFKRYVDVAPWEE